jgi:phosphonate transport system permease protein
VTAETPVGVRPVAPTKAITMALPLVAAVVIGYLSGNFAQIGSGAAWGVGLAIGLLVALRLGKIDTTLVQKAILSIGLIASAVLSVLVLPQAPETIDVLLCIRFGGAWLPAALASALVAHQKGARPTSVLNVAILWLLAAAFALPMAEAMDALVPLDQLRRNQESMFGVAEYMTIGGIIGTLGFGAFLASASRLPGLVAGAGLLLFTVFAAAVVGFSPGRFFGNIGQINQIPNLWPIDFPWAIGSGDWWWPPSWEFGDPFLPNPLVETFRIAITATVLGCLIALPVAFMASTLTAPNHAVYLIDKGFLNFIRTIPDLFWAMILTASIGFGPIAGAIALTIFTMAIMAKLLSETVDAADPGPLEAAKATGGRHFPSVRHAVGPQVLPNYIALSLYIFELTIRSSTILGIVGAGGIGRVIEAQRTTFQFGRVLAVLIPVLIVVIIVEQISVYARRKLV